MLKNVKSYLKYRWKVALWWALEGVYWSAEFLQTWVVNKQSSWVGAVWREKITRD